MQYFKTYEALNDVIRFVSKKNPNLKVVIKTANGRISEIENPNRLRFPYVIGQPISRNLETWACNNDFFMNDNDTCPEEKVFGIRKSQIPKDHPIRLMYPSKFK